MGVFCDRLKCDSTVALDCRTGQNKGRYCEKELLLLLVLMLRSYCLVYILCMAFILLTLIEDIRRKILANLQFCTAKKMQFDISFEKCLVVIKWITFQK